jgi:glycine hydroxymethyltransferase
MSLPWNAPLAESDPEVAAIIQKEKERQTNGLELIASENFTSRAVMECLGSCLTNKYSEGLPGKRYYGGNEFIDKIEDLCIARALKAFHLDPNAWGCNVQPYSGSVANIAALVSVLEPGDKVLGLALPSGGHLSHGHQLETGKKVSATSIFYNCTSYSINQNTGLIDYDKLDQQIQDFKPKLVIAGASAYPRDWDYKRMREGCDKVGAFLMCDIAHISGLVAAQEQNDPFLHAHLVTTTTHKSLRGPRAGVIFFKKGKVDRNGVEYDLQARVNFAVFPSVQGGPHENQIAAIATTLKQVDTPEFKEYARQVKSNAKALGQALIDLGHQLVTGGSDNHLLLWNLRPHGLTGSKVEKLCERAEITVNKNSIVGDKSAGSPSGIRLGSPALTSRGLKEADFKQIAVFLHETVKISQAAQEKSGKSLEDFVKFIDSDEGVKKEICTLREKVHAFASKFPMPGL